MGDQMSINIGWAEVIQSSRLMDGLMISNAQEYWMG
jgi:hypothetical protein